MAAPAVSWMHVIVLRPRRVFLALAALMATDGSSGCTSDDSSASQPEPAASTPVEPPPARPVEVAPVPAEQLQAWHAFATATWWRSGNEIPCDGTLTARPIMGGVTGLMGEGHTCKGADGESVAWWPRGDAACPAGATLSGAPSPLLDMVVCLRGEQGHGRFTLWHEDGSIERSGTQLDGKNDGVAVALRPNGELESVTHFKNGKEHGESIYFFAGGKRVSHSHFEHGKLEGLVTAWHENGNVAFQATYVDDKIEGDLTSWSTYGRVCGASTLHAGTGTLTRYWSNCQVSSTGEMKAGKAVGPWAEFDRNGRPVQPQPR